MQKTDRLLAIEKILAAEEISSHGDLLRKLRAEGIICTQATLSRNLRQLGAIRKPDPRGGYRYVLPENRFVRPAAPGRLQLLPVITGLTDTGGMLLMKTLPGNASNVAIFIDNSARHEIAGTIAGDDTILVIARGGVSSEQIHDCLEMLLPGLHEWLKLK